MSNPGNLLTVFDDAPFRRGPLSPEERSPALTVCERATSKTDAETLLAMCGLLRKDGTP